MATVSFSSWLQHRDASLAESINNEAIAKGWLPHLMMLGALGTAAGKSALPEIPHGPNDEVVPMTAPLNPGKYNVAPNHGGAVPHEVPHESEHDDTDELAHYVADSLMRKLRGVKSKAGRMMDKYGGFGYYLKLFASRFFRRTIPSIKHLGVTLAKAPGVAEKFIHHLENDVSEFLHHMGGEIEGEGPGEELSPFYGKRMGGTADTANGRSEQPSFAGLKNFAQAAPPKDMTTRNRRLHRQQHRG